MSLSESPRLARRRLAYGLADLREGLGWSQNHVAKQLGCSNGTIGNIEARDRVPNEEFLHRLLRLYGREQDIPTFLEIRAAARQREPEWRGIDSSEYVPGFDEFVSLEHSAERIDVYETRLVPGLLQTRDYAWHVLQASRARAGREHKFDVRMRRQEILTGDTPVHVWAILEEHALDRPVGGPEVMRQQYEHLLSLIEHDSVQIQVCPTAIGPHMGMASPFAMLRFASPRDPGLVAVETRVKTIFFESSSEVAQFEYELDHLRTIALSPEQTAVLIEQKKQEVCS